MALSLPALPGDGDVQSVGIDHRSGGEGEEEALGHGPVPDVVQTPGVQHGPERVAGAEDLGGLLQPGYVSRAAGSEPEKQPCAAGGPTGAGPVRADDDDRSYCRRRSGQRWARPRRSGGGTRRRLPRSELDSEGAVLVRSREGALLQDEEDPALPGPLGPDRQAVRREPGPEVDPGPGPGCRCTPRGRSCRESPGELFQQVPGNGLDGVRHGEDTGPAVRPFEGVVALPGRGPVELPDPGRVEVRRVDGDRSIGKEGVQVTRHFFTSSPAASSLGRSTR